MTKLPFLSGLPHSGTSLMMKMLDTGGIEPVTDNIRGADLDNPKGWYEFKKVKTVAEDSSWLPGTRQSFQNDVDTFA